MRPARRGLSAGARPETLEGVEERVPACAGAQVLRCDLLERRWSPDFDSVILDDRVGEELLAHLLDAGAGGGRIGLGELQFDELALADLADIGKAEPLQRVADCLALRVEDPGLETDMDARFHRFPRRAATAAPSAP